MAKAKPGDKRLGAKFWDARSSHGRKPIFADSEQLRSACLEYFEWVENNPLYETKVFHSQGSITTTEVPKMRAMTLDGLYSFLDISHTTWQNYREKEEFIAIIAEIESKIRQQKFAGAAADLLNANIIARDLGLSDKTDHRHTGANGGPIKWKVEVIHTKKE